MPNTALRRYPLLSPGLACALGMAAAAQLEPWKLAFLAATVAVCSLIALMRPRWRQGGAPHLFGLPLLLGIVAHGPIAEPVVEPPGATTTQPTGTDDRALVQVTGRVVSPPRPLRASRSRLPAGAAGAPREPRVRAEIEVFHGAPSARVTVITAARLVESDDAETDPAAAPAYAAPFVRGDQITVTGWLDDGTIWATSAAPVVVSQGSLLGFFDTARSQIRVAWQRRFPPTTAAWWSALILGDRALLSPDVLPRFRRVGLSHLVAISGLHVGIVAALFLLPLRRWRAAPSRSVALLVAAMVGGYAALSGGEPPVLRAALLAACVCLAILRGRSLPLANPLAAAFLLIPVCATNATHSAGFLLSFCAVAAIAAATRRGNVRSPGARPRGAALRVSFAAWWGAGLPLLWLTPEVVPWGPLATLCLLPIVTLLLATGLLTLLPGASYFDALASFVSQVAIALLDTASRWLDMLPATPACWPPLSPFSLALLWCALGWFALGGTFRRLATFPLLLATLTLLAPPPSLGGELVPMGRGQALLLCGPQGVVLYDAGSSDLPDGGARQIRRALWERGRRHVDLLVLSHPHADHVNATLALLRDVTVGTVAVGPRFADADLGAQLLRHLRLRNIHCITVRRGDRLRVGGWAFEVAHPYDAALPGTGLNDDSIAGVIRGHRLSIFVAGDLEHAGLAASPIPPGVAWVLLPHHGRPSPGLSPWLAQRTPALALAGTARRLPQPTREVLERLDVPWRATRRDTPIDLIVTEDGWTAASRDR